MARKNQPTIKITNKAGFVFWHGKATSINEAIAKAIAAKAIPAEHVDGNRVIGNLCFIGTNQFKGAHTWH